MTVATAQISESLQTLIDSRLDTIDRMLLGRASRQDRLAIVREVESQIHELLQASDADELTREDVLAVLARLDPPEAYIPDEIEGNVSSARVVIPSRLAPTNRKGDLKVARLSGILGILALMLVLLYPFAYLLAVNFGSFMPALALLLGTTALTFAVSFVGLGLGIYSRKSGAWALVGMVATSLCLFFALVELLIPFL
jgi:hypothetical protein